MRVEEAQKTVYKKLQGMVDSDANVYNAFLLVHSDKHNIHWNLAHGLIDDRPANAEQPYHTASIAKTFTAILIAMLVEEGRLSYHDPISNYIDDELLKDLHIYIGKDYSKDILVGHLVSNTSGLPDFYEEKPKQGKSFLDLMLDEPSRYWTPQETIQWSKQHLSPRFPPGKKCHYTNTGFNLLGLIIEGITSKAYHEILHERIFKPLNMNHTYLSQYSAPADQNDYPVATLHLNRKKVNVEEHRSFSSIYAGGQTVSTSEDLLKFMRALAGGKLIAKDSLQEMMQWKKLWLGVEYGLGLMKVRMMPFTEKYNVWGHLGSIGSFMLYNPEMDVYVIGNFNKQGYLTKAVRFVFNVLQTTAKVK